MLAQLSFSGLDWLPILLGVGAAYIVFGIAGFGTALVAGPVLIHFMPLSRIIPLLVLLDFVAAFGNLLPSRRDVVRGELLRLLPFMAIGCALGVVFLLQLKSDLLLLLMGLFVTAYALYGLAVKVRPASLSGFWAMPMGDGRRAVRRLVRQRRLPLCAVPERAAGGEGTGARYPERADQLQYGGAADAVPYRRRLCRPEPAVARRLPVAGHARRPLGRAQAYPSAVSRSLRAPGHLAGAGQRPGADRSLPERLSRR
ncbi:hypothetical protein PPS11_16141 [Pseudomonas putida S11]|nr:hypothetical protein PPS11_16141 [Pseudomonas putida S11]